MVVPPTVSGTSRVTLSDSVLVLLGAQLLSILWVGTVIGVVSPAGVPDDLSTPLQVTLNVGLWLGYGLGPLLLCRVRDLSPLPVLRLGARPVDLPAGIVVGVLTQVVVLPLLYWPILRLVDGSPSESAEALVDAADSPLDLALLALAVVLVAPLVEELFFRGLLLTALQQRFNPALAVALSSLLFAAVHRQLLPFPGLALFGVVAALLVVRTGRLGPAWGMHAGFNAATLVMLA